MSQPLPSDKEAAGATARRRILIPNSHGEKLVGLLHETGSKKVVVLCHGFRSSKDEKVFLNITAALTSQGYSVFLFDFAGNGGNVVVLYASRYHDVDAVINLSGRFALDRGIEDRLGKDFLQRIKKDGFIDVRDKTGKVEYQVTEESLMDRLHTDMRSACHDIDNKCRVLIVHGSDDQIVPAEDSVEFAKNISNHKLHIIEGANHGYTSHQDELAKIVLDFLKSNQVEGASGVDT